MCCLPGVVGYARWLDWTDFLSAVLPEINVMEKFKLQKILLDFSGCRSHLR